MLMLGDQLNFNMERNHHKLGKYAPSKTVKKRVFPYLDFPRLFSLNSTCIQLEYKTNFISFAISLRSGPNFRSLTGLWCTNI